MPRRRPPLSGPLIVAATAGPSSCCPGAGIARAGRRRHYAAGTRVLSTRAQPREGTRSPLCQGTGNRWRQQLGTVRDAGRVRKRSSLLRFLLRLKGACHEMTCALKGLPSVYAAGSKVARQMGAGGVQFGGVCWSVAAASQGGRRWCPLERRRCT